MDSQRIVLKVKTDLHKKSGGFLCSVKREDGLQHCLDVVSAELGFAVKHLEYVDSDFEKHGTFKIISLDQIENKAVILAVPVDSKNNNNDDDDEEQQASSQLSTPANTVTNNVPSIVSAPSPATPARSTATATAVTPVITDITAGGLRSQSANSNGEYGRDGERPSFDEEEVPIGAKVRNRSSRCKNSGKRKWVYGEVTEYDSHFYKIVYAENSTETWVDREGLEKILVPIKSSRGKRNAEEDGSVISKCKKQKTKNEEPTLSNEERLQMKGLKIDLEKFRQFLSGKLKDTSRDHMCYNADTLVSGRGGKRRSCPDDPFHPFPVDFSEDFDQLYQEAVDHQKKHRYTSSHFRWAIKWLQQYQTFYFKNQEASFFRSSNAAFAAAVAKPATVDNVGEATSAPKKGVEGKSTVKKRAARKSTNKRAATNANPGSLQSKTAEMSGEIAPSNVDEDNVVFEENQVAKSSVDLPDESHNAVSSKLEAPQLQEKDQNE